MNKYEENIKNIITFEDIDEIVNKFIENTLDDYDYDDSIAIISNRDLIEYVLEKTLSKDWINVRKIDLIRDDEFDLEYMLAVYGNGDLVIQPLTDFIDTYVQDITTAYISMDGDVDQFNIDWFINHDRDVILFGYDDDSEKSDDIDESVDEDDCEDSDDENDEKDYYVNGKIVDKETYNNFISKFSHDNEYKCTNKCKDCKCNKPSKTTEKNEIYMVNGNEVDKEVYEKSKQEIRKMLSNFDNEWKKHTLLLADMKNRVNSFRKLFRW